MPDDYFGPGVAEFYDSDEAEMFAPEVVEPAVDVLAELAADGAALELGIGTGRIGIPLSRRGVPVHGIELSTAMVGQLRAKEGGDAIEVTIGDFATTQVPGRYELAYVVFNSLVNLTTQDEQVACFRNVSDHLVDGGRFVVELNVVDLQRLPPGEHYRPFLVGPDRLGFDEIDVATQHLTSHHYRLVDGRMRRHSMPFRYVWPSELDLMARLAGMTLEHRWADWHRSPFTSESRAHISVWRKESAAFA